jgi:hypothetical protein
VKRSTVVLAACASLLLIFIGYTLFFPKAGLPSAPLRALPADIDAFARVRAARVVASRPWREIVIDRKEDRGIQQVKNICGFNPLESLDEVFVFARPNNSRLEMAVAARGSLSQAKLTDCMTKFSGGTLQDYAHERVAGFNTIRNKRGTDRASFVGRDAFVAGGAEAVSAALAALAGERANAESDPLLKELYASLSADSEIALVARLPAEPKRREMLVERLGLPGDLTEDLRALTLEVQLVEDRIRFALRLSLAGPEQTRALAAQMDEVRGQILALPGLSLVGVGPALRALKIEHGESDVRARGEIRAAVINTLIDRLPALAAMQALAPAGKAAPAQDAGAAR